MCQRLKRGQSSRHLWPDPRLVSVSRFSQQAAAAASLFVVLPRRSSSESSILRPLRCRIRSHHNALRDGFDPTVDARRRQTPVKIATSSRPRPLPPPPRPPPPNPPRPRPPPPPPPLRIARRSLRTLSTDGRGARRSSAERSYRPRRSDFAASSVAFFAAIFALFFRGRVSPGARGSSSASSCLPPRGAVPPFFSRRASAFAAAAARSAFIASRCRLPGFPFRFGFAASPSPSFPSPSPDVALRRLLCLCRPPVPFFSPLRFARAGASSLSESESLSESFAATFMMRSVRSRAMRSACVSASPSLYPSTSSSLPSSSRFAREARLASTMTSSSSVPREGAACASCASWTGGAAAGTSPRGRARRGTPCT